jgi:L-2-hydroxyglutarate oxidase LhgO
MTERPNAFERTDVVVIGAGVVGLAVARRLALAGREVVVVEAEAVIGSHTSSRNSGVIHAGLSSPKAMLKGRLCLRGKELLYRYCADHGVGHAAIGKLVIAPEAAGAEGLDALMTVKAMAEANGLTDLQLLGPAEVRAMEPELATLGALYSPSSGIIDAHDLMLAYQGDIEAKGGALALRCPVLSGRLGDGWIEIDVGGDQALSLRCNLLVNAAGLNAPTVGRAIVGLPQDTVPPRLLAKGSYFVLSGASPFSHLVYPVHTADFRTLHCHLNLAGQLRFGPDMEWVETVDYRVDEARAADFYTAIRRFWPGLPDGALVAGWAGVRPKIGRSRAAGNDFVIQDKTTHGIDGLINLYGIESPGLTSSLAIAEEVGLRIGLPGEADF